MSVRTRFAVFAFKLVFKPLDFFNHRRKRKAATILYIIRRHDARGDRTYGILLSGDSTSVLVCACDPPHHHISATYDRMRLWTVDYLTVYLS